MRIRSKETVIIAVLACVSLPLQPAFADCEVQPRGNQKAVTVNVKVHDGTIDVNKSVRVKQKSQYVRWISNDGPFEITFEDESIEQPQCGESGNQWQCTSAAFCYSQNGSNDYKYSVAAGDIVLDPHVIIDP